MSFKAASNSGMSGAGFKAGPSATKSTIKKATVAKSAQASKTTDSTNSQQTGGSEVAKSEQNQAQAYARPGQTAKSSQQKGESRAQNILNQMKNGRDKGGRSPGSAYNDIAATRQNANDAASWQAMLKGSKDLEATIKTASNAVGQALGLVGKSLAAKMKGEKAPEQAGGKQSAAQEQQQQQQQQQQAAQFAQNDSMGQDGGGGGGAANA